MKTLALTWPEAVVAASAIWAGALVIFVRSIAHMTKPKGPR